MDGRGIYSVIFQEDIDRLNVDHRIIKVKKEVLHKVANELRLRYQMNVVLEDDTSSEYLVSGILIKNRIITLPKPYFMLPSFNEISLSGEVKTSLELLAQSLGLPEIPEKSFIHYVV